MGKRVELPILEPLYNTYQYQTPGTAVLTDNPSIRNWYLSQVFVINCSRKFLSGFTTPQLSIHLSEFQHNPYLDRKNFLMKDIRGCINRVIKNLLNDGYYVYFMGVDDYYIEGKTFYKEKHFEHDGLICGYDDTDKTFCMFAYDSNWVCRKFSTPQKAFNKGAVEMLKKNYVSYMYAIKPEKTLVEFSTQTALKILVEDYLDSDLKKYPEEGEGLIYGLVVHDYIEKYIDKLIDGSIPYERTDRRIFRLIWEHKKVLLECIENIEKQLNLSKKISAKYEEVVREANNMHMLYAAHILKRKDSILPILKSKIKNLKLKEEKLLRELVKTARKDEKI